MRLRRDATVVVRRPETRVVIKQHAATPVGRPAPAGCPRAVLALRFREGHWRPQMQMGGNHTHKIFSRIQSVQLSINN